MAGVEQHLPEACLECGRGVALEVHGLMEARGSIPHILSPPLLLSRPDISATTCHPVLPTKSMY